MLRARLAPVLVSLLLVSCKGGDGNGPDLPTGPSGPAAAVTNPIINRWNVPSGGVFEIWVTHMRPAKDAQIAGDVEYYEAWRNASSERLFIATDFVAEEGHAEIRQGLSAISGRPIAPNSASSPTGRSGTFLPSRGVDWTYWRIRIWVMRPGESDDSGNFIRETQNTRPPDGVLYERFGWRR